MEEADDSDYIVILDKGHVIGEGSPLELKNKYAKDMVIIYNVKEEDIKKLKMTYQKIRNGYKIEVESISIVTDLIIKHKDIFKDYEGIYLVCDNKNGMDKPLVKFMNYLENTDKSGVLDYIKKVYV